MKVKLKKKDNCDNYNKSPAKGWAFIYLITSGTITASNDAWPLICSQKSTKLHKNSEHQHKKEIPWYQNYSSHRQTK